MRRTHAVVALLWAITSSAANHPTGVTFAKDVTPILRKNCQGRHRPREAAPFSLLTFEQAQPWAKAMKEAVLRKKMLPWFADPHYGKYANDRSLNQKDAERLRHGSTPGHRLEIPRIFPHSLEISPIPLALYFMRHSLLARA